MSGPQTDRSTRSSEEKARYYREAESWAADRDRAAARQLRLAWIAAGVCATIAVCEAIAIVALTPLKTVVPYTLLVDRQTGYVEALKPLERETITPDRALTRSFLAQYVIARESFDIASLKDDYRKVALWSGGEARERYVAVMQASNPASPLAALPRTAQVSVQIRSVSSLNADTALVRFTTTRIDPGAQAAPPQYWAAVVTWKFSGEEMSADDRLTNPLGFQVTRYRRDAEAPPPETAVPTATTVQPTVVGAAGPTTIVAVPRAGARVVLPTGVRP